jgi:dipeptide/tripeptide permease
LLFWAFFEQSGSSVNNFTDRNVDRVLETSSVTEDQVGKSTEFRLVTASDSGTLYLSQEFLGHENASKESNRLLEKAIRWGDSEKEASKQASEEELAKTIEAILSQKYLTMTALTHFREFAKREGASPEEQKIAWTFTQESVGKIGLGGTEIPASVFQSVNPIFIVIFGLVFTALWGWLATQGREPSTPVKFALGLVQLGLGFCMLYFGAKMCDSDGMVLPIWLVLMYLLLTTGELCLSPVGLSMVTKLAPARLVSTVMGAWFLATAFSSFLAAIIAQFAAVPEADVVPIPKETVDLYGGVYGMIALMAIGSGIFCLLLAPTLTRWMHVGSDDETVSEKTVE